MADHFSRGRLKHDLQKEINFMCLTTPLKIKAIKKELAELSDGREVSLALIDNPRVGDWVLANADLAVSKVSAKEAKEINNYFKQI